MRISLNPMDTNPMSAGSSSNNRAMPSEVAKLDPVWAHHGALLDQAVELLAQLEGASPEGFVFAHRVGPHVRHILEHYTALLDTLTPARQVALACVDYDDRVRDRLVETDVVAARSRIEVVRRAIMAARQIYPHDVEMPFTARFTTGPAGETVLTVKTSLGRELLFLESHTIHHFAILADQARALGIDMGSDFGKAPATIAHERRMSARGH